MLERARQKMIKAVNDGTGRTDCGENYQLAKQLDERFRAITGTAAGAPSTS